MRAAKPKNASAPQFFFSAPVLLAILLAALFWKSFLPDYVHFSNDGPLGQQKAAWTQPADDLTGAWDDLNSIGFSAGATAVDLSVLIEWALGPVGVAKFLAPIALFILGFGTWLFFRQLKLSPLAAVLGALAAALNSLFLSDACWGLVPHQIAFGMDFIALALIVSNSPETPALIRWTRLVLAGLAVGINVMEAADIGAIFSLFVAAFVFYKALTEENVSVLNKFSRGIARVAIVAMFAGFIALQTVLTLVSTNIQGIAGTQQDATTKAEHWDFATQWSFPKIETLGILVPGLFGYRMDTPNNMPDYLQNFYKGGVYWGAIGRDPAWDRFFAGGKQGSPPLGTMRFNGDGYYAGTLVVLIALWSIAQSLRRQASVFSETHRRFIWFWTAVLVVSLLLGFGRFFEHFYKLLYALPYFSTIRNPNKFLFVFSWALVIIFAYGIHGLSRRYLEVAAGNSTSLPAQLKNWWVKVRGFDRNWTSGCVVIFIGGLLVWLIYGLQKPALADYLQTVGFDEGLAKQIAAFSIGQVGWFILFFALATGLATLVLAGVFSGRRAKWGGIFLGALLILDLGRADLPWIVHWNYIQKYDIDPADPANSTNPIINFLRDKPYEHRVAYGLPSPLGTPSQFALFENLYKIEWAQHHFPYYNIQSLDIIQMSRMPVDLEAFESAFRIGIKQDNSGRPVIAPETFPRVGRLWELTDTRYLLGPAALLDLFNWQFDPAQHRFRIVQRFDVAPKPGIGQPTKLEELTTVPNDNGSYALFEFTGALPRAGLYSHWQVSTNDDVTLKTLAASNFDPAKIVLVSTNLPPSPINTTNENSSTVEFKSYAPKDIVFDAKTYAPSVLLLNDKFDSNWRVQVDSKPAELLRCNFIMRGVYLTPGAHTVELQFKLPNVPLYVTCAAWATGILLCGFLVFSTRRTR
jgi:hypothetical protein